MKLLMVIVPGEGRAFSYCRLYLCADSRTPGMARISNDVPPTVSVAGVLEQLVDESGEPVDESVRDRGRNECQ